MTWIHIGQICSKQWDLNLDTIGYYRCMYIDHDDLHQQLILSLI